MAMRLSGLMSGMDTETIVQELVAVRRTKVDAKVKGQTKLEWKQEAWKELNTKLKNLQAKFISDMRLEASYSKKTTKVSDDTAASILTGKDAVNSVQELEINQLAKTAYLTGGEVKGLDDKDVTALTKISDLLYGDKQFSGSSVISLTSGGKTTDIEIDENTTISDFLNKVKDAGLNASFDAKNQRFFISAKESGAKNDFSFSAADANATTALQALGLQESLVYNADPAKQSATMAEYVKWADYYVAGDDAATIANMQSMIDGTITSKTDAYLNEHKKLEETVESARQKIDELAEKYGHADADDTYTATLDDLNEQIKAKKAEIEAMGDDTDADAKKAAEEELKTLEADAESLQKQNETIADSETRMAKIGTYINIADDGTATATDELIGEVEQFYIDKAAYAAEIVEQAKAGTIAGGATKVAGQDSEILLNGATFKGSSNVFEINGLTITALRETAENETITVTTQDDVDGIYDMVKNFLKEYNTLINEMDKLYNADSAEGFEPLSDEEKEALTETEVEKYEKKIKDALLRKDSNLRSVSSALKDAMSSGYTVNGKTMYLADFGINTLGYFTAADNEKNAYHIDGDKDDASTSGKTDVLRGLISTDSKTVISFFTSLAQNIYNKMDDMSKSVNGYRTFGSFYDDKKMKSDYSDYTSKIADMEQKLADYEDKWYAKFAAMETAMAKMQSNANAITGLLGG